MAARTQNGKSGETVGGDRETPTREGLHGVPGIWNLFQGMNWWGATGEERERLSLGQEKGF